MSNESKQQSEVKFLRRYIQQSYQTVYQELYCKNDVTTCIFNSLCGPAEMKTINNTCISILQ